MCQYWKSVTTLTHTATLHHTHTTEELIEAVFREVSKLKRN